MVREIPALRRDETSCRCSVQHLNSFQQENKKTPKKCKFRCHSSGSDKKLIEKVGLHHLPARESHFCTLRINWTGLVTIYLKNYKQSLRL